MPIIRKAIVLPMVLAVTLAGRAVAQSAQDAAAAAASCQVDEQTSSGVQRAVLFITSAQGQAGPDAISSLQSGIRALDQTYNPAPQDAQKYNLTGRSWEEGRLLSMWLAQPAQPVIASRGSLGFVTDTATKIDLSVVIDSMFKIVETDKKIGPGCVAYANMWRQQGGFINLLQTAITYANDKKLDSAEITAHQALRISALNPYGHLVLGEVADAKDKPKEAIQYYEETIDEAKKDTTYDPLRRETYDALGRLALMAANDAKDPTDKKFYVDHAKTAYVELCKDPGTKYGDTCKEGLGKVAILQGDTTAIKNAYKEVLADPSSHKFDEVVRAGYAANSANQNTDAIKLFRVAVEMNPYHRDGLFNLSVLLVKADSAPQAAPFVDRLLKVDPSNVTVYAVAQTTFGTLQHLALAKARRYAFLTDSFTKAKDIVKAKFTNDSAKIFDDSATKLTAVVVEVSTTGDSLPANVTFNEWTVKDNSVTLGGTLTNRTPTTRNFAMHVEFLDKNGTVVSTGDIPPITALDSKASKDFEVTGTGAGIVAFRYAPIK